MSDVGRIEFGPPPTGPQVPSGMTVQAILEARVALLERQIADLLPIVVSLIAANKTLIEMLTLANASQETAH